MITVTGRKPGEMTSEELVDGLVALDREAKQNRRRQNAYKAELQSRAVSEMEDHNVKFVKFYSHSGSVSVMDAQTLDVLNPDRLREAIGGVFDAKVTVTTAPKYDYDKKLEQMLKAVFTGDYTFDYSLEEFLQEQMGVADPKQRKVLLKKLKGEFEKDRAALVSVLYPGEDSIPDLDAELWYIYRIKNAELIRAFLPEEFLDRTIAQIRESLIVDVKTQIKLDYREEED